MQQASQPPEPCVFRSELEPGGHGHLHEGASRHRAGVGADTQTQSAKRTRPVRLSCAARASGSTAPFKSTFLTNTRNYVCRSRPEFHCDH